MLFVVRALILVPALRLWGWSETFAKGITRGRAPSPDLSSRAIEPQLRALRLRGVVQTFEKGITLAERELAGAGVFYEFYYYYLWWLK